MKKKFKYEIVRDYKGNEIRKYVNFENKVELMDTLNELNGKAKVRTISIYDIERLLEKAEIFKKNYGLTKPELKACVLSYDTFETMPKKYRYPEEYSIIKISTDGKTFEIVGYEREKNFSNYRSASSPRWKINFPETLNEKILNSVADISYIN